MTREQWDEATGYGEDEHYLVDAIKKHLRTPEQKAEMDRRDITIEDVLNGRTEGQHEAFITSLFEDWNAKLDWQAFGF